VIDCVVVVYVYVVCVCCGVVGMGTAQYRPLVGGLDLPYGRSTLVGWPVLRLPGLSTAQHTHIHHSTAQLVLSCFLVLASLFVCRPVVSVVSVASLGGPPPGAECCETLWESTTGS
jgi:hypothetical protein